MDSFDESGIKSNLVREYLRILGNKKETKIVISCRTDYVNSYDLFMP